jgi:DNA-binding MarR family transcriptional regulator
LRFTREHRHEWDRQAEYGAAAGLFTSSINISRRASREIRAGAVWTNTRAAINDGFAEGGCKQSGIGRLRGPLAITEFPEAKTVVRAIPPGQDWTGPGRGDSLESSSHWYSGSVTEGTDRAEQEPPVKWLTAGELESWLSLVRLTMWLPWSIDQQLQRDSKLGMVEYQVLAMLSKSPGRTLRMSSLAVMTNASLSRLSHLVKRLEERGLVRREPDPADGRFTHAIVTDEGFRILAEAAPGHVAHVRSLVIDALSPEQLRRVGRAADHIMSRIDTGRIN